jgi:hypothetical protein
MPKSKKKAVAPDKPKVIDESVKFAWAFLILNGKRTNGKWSYYGCGWEPAVSGRRLEVQFEEMNDIRERVERFGIDWTQTEIPQTHENGYFTGTFDSRQGECLATIGTLYLNNGDKYLIGSSDRDAASLVETAKLMIQKRESAVQKLADKL